jgi:hypothetical protein
MTSLKEFSEGIGKIGIVGLFILRWNDSRLAWKPSDYGGNLYGTTLFTQDTWVPQLVPLNPFDKFQKSLLDGRSCDVTWEGEVSCESPDLYEATCDADVTYYPFDSQTCTLKYYVPAQNPSEMILRPKYPTFFMFLYETNGLWSIRSTRIYYHVNTYGLEELRLEINMKRRTTYYVAGLILPICLMSFLQILVFALPVESGERMGFSITVLLAVAVFLTIIQDKLPEASDPNVSYLTYKLLVDMLLGCAMVFAVVVGMNFYHKLDDTEIPARLQGFARGMTRCKRKTATVYVGETENIPAKNVNDTEDTDVTCKITWKEVGLAFDRLFLIVFFVILICNNIVYLLMMSNISP